MKTCAKCGTENPDDAAFCANCGYAFTPGEPAQAGPGPVPPPTGMGMQGGGAPLPPPTYGQQQAYYPSQSPPPGAPYYGPTPYQVVPQVSNGKATASLVLGIIGLFICPIICSVIALILGYQAKNEISVSGGRMSGDSYATAGIILGWVGVALFVVLMTVWAIVIAVGQNASVLLPVMSTLSIAI